MRYVFTALPPKSCNMLRAVNLWLLITLLSGYNGIYRVNRNSATVCYFQKALAHRLSQPQALPAQNLFGQPAVSPVCRVKEVLCEGTTTKYAFRYNDKNQLISHIEVAENAVTNIYYNEQEKINRVTGLEGNGEMNLAYDDQGRVKTVHVTSPSGTQNASVHYTGDKIVKVEYAGFSVTYYFDAGYDLSRAVVQSKEPDKPANTIEANITAVSEYRNFLLSTGDYRFVALLYGDYIQEGGYTAASRSFYKKYAASDKSSGTLKTTGYEVDVEAANENKFPTTVLFRFSNTEDNYRIHISYDCP